MDIPEESEEEYAAMLAEQLASYRTVNEVRAELGLPPIPHGDVSLNPKDHE